MNLDYKKTYKIELLNEFANSVYAKVVNLGDSARFNAC
ncbi:hypothetical protein ACFSF7_00045 [Ligilactobacillus acidipiscis]